MKTRLFVKRVLAVLVTALGATLCYFAGRVSATEIRPQVAESGWSLQGSIMILNRNWVGSELYILVALYALVGAALVIAGVRAWGVR